MINIIKEFNNQDWRFNRFQYWIYSLVIQIVVMIIAFVLWIIWDIFWMSIIVWIAWVLSPISLLYISFTSTIKRLHDLDKSGWMSLLLLVPFANIYLFVICGFFKWTPWVNKFWPDPLGWEVSKELENNSTPDEL